MIFPTTYPFLKQNRFEQGEFAIVPIRYQDRIDIMRWRNEQIYHCRQAKPLTEADQDRYFSTVVASLFEHDKPQQILFSYLQNGVLLGYGGLVHINWTDHNAEISFLIDTQLEKEQFAFHWQTYLGLLEQAAFTELNLHKIYTYAFDLRPHLYPVLESSGYHHEATLPEHCYFAERYIDVVIHAKVNARLLLRPIKIT